MPEGRIAVLGRDQPGYLSAGLSAGVQKPSDLHLRTPSQDTDIAGRQDWTLPGWTLGTHLAWTPWEGVTVAPEGFVGGGGSHLAGGLALGLGLHAELEWMAWQLEGRFGASWSRSEIDTRTKVSDLSVAPDPFLDPVRVQEEQGFAPWGQVGLQFESNFRHRPVQIWSLARWSWQNLTLLEDASRDAMAIASLQVFQAGGGLHREFGDRDVLTLGVIHSFVLPGWSPHDDETTKFVVQWETRLGARSSRPTEPDE